MDNIIKCQYKLVCDECGSKLQVKHTDWGGETKISPCKNCLNNAAGNKMIAILEDDAKELKLRLRNLTQLSKRIIEIMK